jgi:hypothetical protein
MRLRTSILIFAYVYVAAWAAAPAVNVTGKVSFKPSSLVYGKSAQGIVTLTVPAGYHINANPASQDFLIPTVLTPSKNALYSISSIVYPMPKTVTVAGAPTKVYEGTVPIKFKLTMKPLKAKQKPASSVPFVAAIRYQACNATNCFAPSLVTVKTTLKVVR